MTDVAESTNCSITVTRGGVADAARLHGLMLEAFAEFRETLKPPSSALSETVEDMERALAEGGAVIAWDEGQAIAFARFKQRGNKLELGAFP